MKKLFGCILSLVVAVMLVFTPAEHVYAQGLGLSVSSSSIAVGKTVKAVSYTHLDVYKRQDFDCFTRSKSI